MIKEVVLQVASDGIYTQTGFKRPLGHAYFREGDVVFTDGNYVLNHSPVRTYGMFSVPTVQEDIKAVAWLMLSNGVAHIVTYDGSGVNIETVSSIILNPDYSVNQRVFAYSADGFVCADLCDGGTLKINWNGRVETYQLDSNDVSGSVLLKADANSISLMCLNYSEYDGMFSSENTYIAKTIKYDKNGSFFTTDNISSLSDVIAKFNSIKDESISGVGGNNTNTSLNYGICSMQLNKFSFSITSRSDLMVPGDFDYEMTAWCQVDCGFFENNIISKNKTVSHRYVVNNAYWDWNTETVEDTKGTYFIKKMNNFNMEIDSADWTVSVCGEKVSVSSNDNNLPLLILPTTDGSDLFYLDGKLYLVKGSKIASTWDIGNIYNSNVPTDNIDSEKLKAMIKPKE